MIFKKHLKEWKREIAIHHFCNAFSFLSSKFLIVTLFCSVSEAGYVGSVRFWITISPGSRSVIIYTNPDPAPSTNKNICEKP
jgi:hypothetical protein